MMQSIGFKWMEKYIVKMGIYRREITEIRKLPATEVFRQINIDLAYNYALDSAQ